MNPFQIVISRREWLKELPGLLDIAEPALHLLEDAEDMAVQDGIQYALVAGAEVLQQQEILSNLFDRMDPLQLRVVFAGRLNDWIEAGLPAGVLHTVIHGEATMNELALALRSLYELHVTGETVMTLESCIDRYSGDLDEILTIGKQLTAERDHTRLVRLMLDKSMDLTGADAGSIFLVEEDEQGERCMRFAYTDTRSLIQNRRFEAFTMPLSKRSLAGYVALTGNPLLIEDVYELDPHLEYSFDPGYDQREGYRTKSMLVVPLVNHKRETLGAIQLINAKEDGRFRANTLRQLEEMITSFTVSHKDLVMAIAGQAAVAIENNRLYHNIERLFEGFVEASVTAIESRDPTTSGHSFRVAQLTEELARVADNATEGPWDVVSLSEENLKEIRYASLLHDFGKVGVREEVLTKPKKLLAWQMTEMSSRFEWLIKDTECRYLRDRLRALEAGHSVSPESAAEMARELERLSAWLDVVRSSNEPSLLAEDAPALLEEISKFNYRNAMGEEAPLITGDECRILSIKRGSLTPEEWNDMQSHVSHTYEFLRRIPWTKGLSRVPEIAWGHHEKLDGSGYPRGLKSPDIPLGSRMMTVADIYDALTAADRPYKKAVSHEKALDILHWEADGGKVDSGLLDLFIQRRVYEVIRSTS